MASRLNMLIRTPASYARWLGGYDGIPVMSRPTFRYDLLSSLFGALGHGTLIIPLVTQFARKGLFAPKWIVALLIAQSCLGNLLNSFFAQDMARRRRVPVVVTCRVGMALFMLCIATLPRQAGLAGSFAALLVAPYLMASVIFNIQNITRHSNYPDSVRGRIYSRLMVINFVGLAISAGLGGYALDKLAWGHSLVFACGAVMMVVSAAFYSRIRIRRERAMIRNGLAQPFNLLAGFKLLFEDRKYGLYMFWQMVFGTANNMTWPVMTLIMTDYLKVSYSKGISALTIIPMLMALLMAPLAGRLFDHIRFGSYRMLNSGMWAAAKVLLFLGAYLESWPIVIAAAIAQGMGMSTGSIAFSLGHTYYSTPERSHDYLGINLSLQGIRGVIGPFVGVLLLNAIGISVLPLAAGIMLIACVGFFFMPSPPGQADRAARPLWQNPFSVRS